MWSPIPLFLFDHDLCHGYEEIKRKRKTRCPEDDAENLRRDWANVGRDLSTALGLTDEDQ